MNSMRLFKSYLGMHTLIVYVVLEKACSSVICSLMSPTMSEKECLRTSIECPNIKLCWPHLLFDTIPQNHVKKDALQRTNG